MYKRDCASDSGINEDTQQPRRDKQTQIPLILALVSNAVANKGSYAPHACGLRPNDQPEGDGAYKYRL